MRVTPVIATLLGFTSILAYPTENSHLEKRGPPRKKPGGTGGTGPPKLPGGKTGGDTALPKGQYGRDSDSREYIDQLRASGKLVPSRKEFRPQLAGHPEEGDTGIHYLPSADRPSSSSSGSIYEGVLGDTIPWTADVQRYADDAYPHLKKAAYRPATTAVKDKNRARIL